jgi:hypothetical protein
MQLSDDVSEDDVDVELSRGWLNLYGITLLHITVITCLLVYAIVGGAGKSPLIVIFALVVLWILYGDVNLMRTARSVSFSQQSGALYVETMFRSQCAGSVCEIKSLSLEPVSKTTEILKLHLVRGDVKLMTGVTESIMHWLDSAARYCETNCGDSFANLDIKSLCPDPGAQLPKDVYHFRGMQV